jgi:hypothetical protein
MYCIFVLSVNQHFLGLPASGTHCVTHWALVGACSALYSLTGLNTHTQNCAQFRVFSPLFTSAATISPKFQLLVCIFQRNELEAWNLRHSASNWVYVARLISLSCLPISLYGNIPFPLDHYCDVMERNSILAWRPKWFSYEILLHSEP